LATLRRYLVRKRVDNGSISKEHLRRVLQSLGITAQRTRTWKGSNDPLFEAKKGWGLATYKGARPAPSTVSSSRSTSAGRSH
jgi:hypothetical protein